MKLSKRIIVIELLMLSCLGMISVPLPAQQSDRSPKVLTEKTAPADSLLNVTSVENKIIVSNAPANSMMEIYNIIGTKIKEIEIKQSSGEYTLNLPKGYYIIRVADTVRKIVIR